MIKKSFFFANSRFARTASLLPAVLLVLVTGVGPASKAASVPAWLAATNKIDIGPFGAGSAAVVVGQWTEFTVDATGKFVSTERRALRVLDVKAAEHYLRVLGYESNDAAVVSMQSWVISASGRVQQSEKKDVVTASAYANFILYSDDRAKILNIPGAEQGSLVGYEIVRSGHLPLNGERFELEEGIPVRQGELRVSVPSGSLRWFINHPDRVEVVSQSPTEAVFRTANRLGLPPEGSAPPISSLAASVFVNYDPKGPAAIQSWEDAGRVIHPLLSGAEKPSPEIATQVETLSAGQADLLAKLNASYSFVSRQIRYVAVEIGIGGFEPHPAADVLRNRYGDCKDKATLLLTMLDHLGLRGYPALVGTRRDVEADPKVPTLATFDHMIVALPISAELEPAVRNLSSYDPMNRILWIDPTSEHDPLGQLPEMDQGVFALISYPDRGDLKRIPEMPADGNGINYRAELHLGPDGAGTASVEQTYLGPSDAERHSFYRNLSQDQIRRSFDEQVARYATQTAFQKGSVSGIEDTNSPIVEKFSFAGNFANASTGDSWFFQPLFLAGMAVPEISPRPRVLPLELGIPYHLQGEHRVELPLGMTVAGVPENSSLVTEFGSLKVEYTLHGNVLIATESLSFTLSRIPPERFEDFRTFVNAVLRVQRVLLRAVKAP